MHVSHYIILTDTKCPRNKDISSCPLKDYMNNQEAVSLLAVSKTSNFVEMNDGINFYHLLKEDTKKTTKIHELQKQMKAICAECKKNNKNR